MITGATGGRIDVLIHRSGFFPVQSFFERALPEDIQGTAIGVCCLNRDEHAEDLTGTVFFLASPDADFVTGQTIVGDGGNEML